MAYILSEQEKADIITEFQNSIDAAEKAQAIEKYRWELAHLITGSDTAAAKSKLDAEKQKITDSIKI